MYYADRYLKINIKQLVPIFFRESEVIDLPMAIGIKY